MARPKIKKKKEKKKKESKATAKQKERARKEGTEKKKKEVGVNGGREIGNLQLSHVFLKCHSGQIGAGFPRLTLPGRF